MLNKYKSFLKAVSYVLIFFIVFNIIGMSAADAKSVSNNKPTKHSLKANVGELLNKAPDTKMELKSKRTKYSTRYINPDGSFTEEIFLEPKFYNDTSDNKWKEIDNNLKANTKKAGKMENKANDFKVNFTNKVGTDEITSIEKNNKSIAFIP